MSTELTNGSSVGHGPIDGAGASPTPPPIPRPTAGSIFENDAESESMAASPLVGRPVHPPSPADTTITPVTGTPIVTPTSVDGGVAGPRRAEQVGAEPGRPTAPAPVEPPSSVAPVPPPPPPGPDRSVPPSSVAMSGEGRGTGPHEIEHSSAAPTPGFRAPTPDRGEHFRTDPASGLVLGRGNWLGIGSHPEDLRFALEQLEATPPESSTADALTGLMASRPSLVALARHSVTEPWITVSIRSGGSVHVVRHGVARQHLIGDGTVTLLVIDRPFDSASVNGFGESSGPVTRLEVPSGRYAAPGTGLTFTPDGGVVTTSTVGSPGSTDAAGSVAVPPERSMHLATPPAGVRAQGSSRSGPRLALGGKLWPIGDEVVIGSGPFHSSSDEVAVSDRFVDAIHAGFLVVGGEVHLADLGSRTGTYVRVDASRRWTRVDPDEPVLLDTACDIRTGRTTFSYLP